MCYVNRRYEMRNMQPGVALMSYRTHTGARRGERSAFALLGRRIAAYLLDMLILFGVLAPAGQFILWLLNAAADRADDHACDSLELLAAGLALFRPQ